MVPTSKLLSEYYLEATLGDEIVAHSKHVYVLFYYAKINSNILNIQNQGSKYNMVSGIETRLCRHLANINEY